MIRSRRVSTGPDLVNVEQLSAAAIDYDTVHIDWSETPFERWRFIEAFENGDLGQMEEQAERVRDELSQARNYYMALQAHYQDGEIRPALPRLLSVSLPDVKKDEEIEDELGDVEDAIDDLEGQLEEVEAEIEEDGVFVHPFDDGAFDYDPEGPMMGYYYPLDTHGGGMYDEDELRRMAIALIDLPLCLVEVEESFDTTLALALTGGGMDLSWEIAEGFMRLGYLPPAWITDLPRIGKRDTLKNRWIIDGVLATARFRLAQATGTYETLKQRTSDLFSGR